MNARLNKENVLRTAKRILGLAGLASLLLVCAGSAWSQSRPSQTVSTSVRPVVSAPAVSPAVPLSSVTTTTKHVVAQNSPAKPSAPKGESEGIKVHGHWTIEVRNPDGKVVTHREFENAIGLDGGNVLAALLQGSIVPQGLLVQLSGSICVAGQCYLAPSTSPCATLIGPTFTYGATCLDNVISTVVPSSLSDQLPDGPLTLTGTFPAPATGVIGAVYSGVVACLPAVGSSFKAETSTFSPASCVALKNSSTGPYSYLLQLTGTTLSSATNCGTTGQLPCTVNVTKTNQSVSVTVQISFH